MKKFNLFARFFNEDSKQSSIRLALLGMGGVCAISILSSSFTIIWDVTSGNVPNWQGIAIYDGAILSGYGILMGVKSHQKGKEKGDGS